MCILNLTNLLGSLTDEVAMDCEMVGVSQGTKSALGRVTLVYILFSQVFVVFLFELFSSGSSRIKC